MKDIPSLMPKRDDVLVTNQYHIISLSTCEDYHIVLYYIGPQTGQLIVRRLDHDEGWDQPLFIRIYSRDLTIWEDILVPPSSQNTVTSKALLQQVTLVPLDMNYPQKIPKRILQTSFSRQIWNQNHENALMTFLELNPEYEYVFLVDKECRKFIQSHFEERVLLAYDRLIPKAFQSDLFRACYIYIHGGCYFDNKQILKSSLHRIIPADKDCVYCLDEPKEMMHNGVFFSVAGTTPLLHYIYNIVEKVEQEDYGGRVLGITGPLLFYHYTKDQYCPLRFYRPLQPASYLGEEIIVNEQNELVLYRRYFGYYQKHRKENYGTLWKQKKIFFHQCTDLKNFRFLVYPSKKQIPLHHFTFSLQGEQCKMVYSPPKGQKKIWKEPLLLQIIHQRTHDQKEVEILPFSNTDFYMIDLDFF